MARTVLAAAMCLAVWCGHVHAADITLFSPGAMMSSLKTLVPQFEAASGHKVAVTYAPALAIPERIKNGEAIDLAIMGEASADELDALGKLVPGSKTIVARVGVGVFVRRGDPKPDIAGVDAFTRAVMNANVIAYSDPTLGGTASNYVNGLLASLDITGSIKAKTKLATQYRSLANSVAAGGVDFGLNQITEIMADARLELVGPLPAELQRYTNYTAAVIAGGKDPAAGKAFIEFLATPAAVAIMRRNGFEPR